MRQRRRTMLQRRRMLHRRRKMRHRRRLLHRRRKMRHRRRLLHRRRKIRHRWRLFHRRRKIRQRRRHCRRWFHRQRITRIQVIRGTVAVLKWCLSQLGQVKPQQFYRSSTSEQPTLAMNLDQPQSRSFFDVPPCGDTSQISSSRLC